MSSEVKYVGVVIIWISAFLAGLWIPLLLGAWGVDNPSGQAWVWVLFIFYAFFVSFACAGYVHSHRFREPEVKKPSW